MFVEYLYLFKYLIFCFIISFLMFSISFFFVYQKPEVEKLSSYECGFILLVMLEFNLYKILCCWYFIYYFWFRNNFSISMIITLTSLNIYGICIMFLFLFILSIGFAYEWGLGALIFK